MRTYGRALAALALLLFGLAVFGAASASAAKPRAVVLFDPELDDQNTMIRYLLYANEFDTEAIVYQSSGVHWAGDGKGTLWAVAGARVREPEPVPVHLVALEAG